MPSKEECKRALEYLHSPSDAETKMYSVDILKKLIDDSFDLIESFKELERTSFSQDCELYDVYHPEPYKFEDVKPDMWVWDSYWEECFEISELYKKKNEIDILIHDNNINKKRYETIKFEENRFYPVQCANEVLSCME